MAGWEIRLVGSMEVRRDGVPVPIPAAKQRVLIAALALTAGAPVTVERLIACLWDERPPSGARNTVKNYVLRLRRIVAADAGPGVLVSSPAGYRLEVDPDVVDVLRFRSLVRTARSAEPEQAEALLDQALVLWRGEPLADVPSDVLHREVVPGLVELRLAALQQRIDLDLVHGRHAERIAELVELSTVHPLRERFWAQLMLAFHRSGRAGEALAAYRKANTILAEELGINPGPQLQALHHAILTDDPGLAGGAGRAATMPAQPAPASVPSARQAIPRQLPPASVHFVGRTRELGFLDTQLATTKNTSIIVISAIAGMAGIGKTALALHWAHHNTHQFPDGQLYINLRGYHPTTQPIAAPDALRTFLTALGVPGPSIPTDPDERVALYRTRMADRTMLVILDNARDAAQVRPLLPGASGCVVIATSRDQLAGLIALDGATPLGLELLTHDKARELLARRLGEDRVADEPAAADDLIRSCARLPLALNIAAARAALHPTQPLAALAEELRDTHRRLDVLTTGDTTADVRAVFSWSCRTLEPGTARIFRFLGLHRGPELSLLAIASLTGDGPTTTRNALDELARAHLVTEPTPGRYTLHDLLRAYATEEVHTHHNEAETQTALKRLLDFYTHTAGHAEELMNTARTAIPIKFGPPAPGVHPQALGTAQDASAWLDSEHPNLLAAQEVAVSHAWHLSVWQLAWSLNTVQLWWGDRSGRLAAWQAAMEASGHLPGPTARIHAHRHLGSAYVDLERDNEALEHLNQALTLAERHHDLDQQARIQLMLYRTRLGQRDYRQALEHAARGRDLHLSTGQPTGEGRYLTAMGHALAKLGEFDAARACGEAALALERSLDDLPGQTIRAATLDDLGYILHRTGHHRQAIERHQEALGLLADIDHYVYAAGVFDNLGHPYAALGDRERASTTWHRALELYRQNGQDEAADRVQRQLDTLGRPGS
ncbi:BTAD domain-containing putative transcriptional regulator [Amycolatopsis sp. PS_44_ISF1]|uniref:AfsR/SARP family transcriptional regulator n=1 Tax=Amycolatopsis sp. PS_44_ISF1 TaxID=2974917 RepID=UPI0028E06FA5|nr:BTAD domain-containing putative transcriptional regulator [Amycolatopsis sp. PS_44_ISF1]MDT8912054.1 tetratricopeptide repeat protein [Amycolatopsis sp. PS_44_ISF1]